MFRETRYLPVIEGKILGADEEHDGDYSHFVTMNLVGNAIAPSNVKVSVVFMANLLRYANVVEQVLSQTFRAVKLLDENSY